MLYRTVVPSPLGPLTLAADGDALCGLWLPDQKYFGAGLLGEAVPGNAPAFDAARTWLSRYFAGERPDPRALTLAPRGSEFARGVWQLLLSIPYGGTTTYGALAVRMAQARGAASMSAQAVGGAVGHNPISIVIPCHRVLGARGALTGYAGGVDKKRWLLEHEGAPL